MAAVRVGGALTATSASRHYGMWTVDDDRLHVLVPRHASRLHLDPSPHGAAVWIHWARMPGAVERPITDPLQVVADAAHCLPPEVAVALADSALNKRIFHIAELETIAPRIAARCDGASQSGTESLTRFRLRSLRLPVRTQVAIRGVGHVDLLVGDRLVIECDSESFHDGYRSERDYDRDMSLVEQGYIVLRLRYRHVMFEWARVEALVLKIVRAGRHRWHRGRNSEGTVLGF